MLKIFDVACFDKTSGKFLWSVSQEAATAVEAIAQTVLPPDERLAFIRANDELPEVECEMPHPQEDMSDWAVIRAEFADHFFRKD